MKEFKSLLQFYRAQWYFKYWVGSYLVIFVGVFVILVLPHLIPAEKVKDGEVKGLIFRNQIWEGEIRITGDTITFPFTKVEVLKGTKILISSSDDRSNFVIRPWFLKKGINSGENDRGVLPGQPFWDESEKVQLRLARIEAKGTVDEPIFITSNSPEKGRFDINIIALNSGSLEYVNFSNYRQLKVGQKISISNSHFNNIGDCAICIDGGQQQIENNVFENSAGYFINTRSGTPIIVGNKFLRSLGDGLLFNGNKDSNLKISDNFFDMSDKTVIDVLQQEEGGEILGNYFTTGRIRLPCSSKVTIENNIIFGQVIFEPQRICPENYHFKENFWGIKNPDDVLKARVIGRNDDFDVILSDVLLEPPFTEDKFK